MVKKKAAASKNLAKTVAGTGAKKNTVKRRNKEKPLTSRSTNLTKQVKTEKKKAKVKFKSTMLREEAISYFEAIIAGLKRGSIQIRQGDDAVVLKPSPQLDVEVKAASKNQDESIEFEIRWRTASDSELTISTD